MPTLTIRELTSEQRSKLLGMRDCPLCGAKVYVSSYDGIHINGASQAHRDKGCGFKIQRIVERRKLMRLFGRWLGQEYGSP